MTTRDVQSRRKSVLPQSGTQQKAEFVRRLAGNAGWPCFKPSTPRFNILGRHSGSKRHDTTAAGTSPRTNINASYSAGGCFFKSRMTTRPPPLPCPPFAFPGSSCARTSYTTTSMDVCQSSTVV